MYSVQAHADSMTGDGVDNEHGTLDCSCGSVFHYRGWTAPETIGWFELHESRGHWIAADVTKDCSCGLGDHPNGCAPVGYWA